MIIQTKAYGAKEVDERQLISFPMGIFGFETYHRWALLDAEEAPFYWLQSLDDKNLAFILLDPFVIRPDFEIELQISEEKILDNPENPQNLLVFAIVTIPEKSDDMTANLQGPIVINKVQAKGVQSIQIDSRWKTKHKILEELARKSETPKEAGC